MTATRDDEATGGGEQSEAARAAKETGSRWRRAGAWAAWAVGAGGAAVVIAAAAAGAVATLEHRAAEAPRPDPTPPLPVEVVEARYVDGFETFERYAGRIEPARQAELGFERSGRVIQVMVDEGDAVDIGHRLAVLSSGRLRAERLRLEAEARRLVAERTLAERTSERQSRLADRGFSSDQSFDEARYRADAFQAQIEAVEAQIEALDIDIDKSELRAPFAGVIAERRIDEGAVAAMGAPVLSLQEIGRPQARIGVPPEVAARLAIGDTHPLDVRGARQAARLAAIRPDVDPRARTVELLFDLAPETDLARMGEIARLELASRVDARGVWLPISALQEGRSGLWTVYTVRETDDGALVIGQEAVELQHVADQRVFVAGTLSDGARVVANGLGRIARGQRVAIAPATGAADFAPAPARLHN